MHRVDTTDNAAALPAIDGPGPNPDGFFRKFISAPLQRGTVVPTDWLNSVQEEIIGAIIAAGLTPTKGTLDQLEDAIVLLAGTTDLTLFAQSDVAAVNVFTAHGRVIISCLDTGNGSPTASGAASAVVACDGSVSASGAAAAVLASRGGTASGARSLLAASEGLCFVGGERNSVISCEGTGINRGNGGAFLACQDDPLIDTGTENGLIAASRDKSQILTGADQCAIIGADSGNDIGANASRSLMLGVSGCSMGENAITAQSALIGCGLVTLDGLRSAIVACLGNGTNASIINSGAVSLIMCSTGTVADPTTIASGAVEALIAASENATIGASVEKGAIIACDAVDLTTSGSKVGAFAVANGLIAGTAAFSALVACSNGEISGAAGASALVGCAAVTSEKPTITGGQGFVAGSAGKLALSGLRAAAIACHANLATAQLISGDQSMLMGVEGACNITGDNFLVVGSTFGLGPTVALNDGIGGGTGTALTWDIASATGHATLQLLTLQNLKSGASAAGAGAGTDEVYISTAGHPVGVAGVLVIN